MLLSIKTYIALCKNHVGMSSNIYGDDILVEFSHLHPNT